MQDLSGVYVFNVNEREPLDRPTARLIKEFSNIEGKTWGDSFYGSCIVVVVWKGAFALHVTVKGTLCATKCERHPEYDEYWYVCCNLMMVKGV